MKDTLQKIAEENGVPTAFIPRPTPGSPADIARKNRQRTNITPDVCTLNAEYEAMRKGSDPAAEAPPPVPGVERLTWPWLEIYQLRKEVCDFHSRAEVAASQKHANKWHRKYRDQVDVTTNLNAEVEILNKENEQRRSKMVELTREAKHLKSRMEEVKVTLTKELTDMIGELKERKRVCAAYKAENKNLHKALANSGAKGDAATAQEAMDADAKRPFRQEHVHNKGSVPRAWADDAIPDANRAYQDEKQHRLSLEDDLTSMTEVHGEERKRLTMELNRQREEIRTLRRRGLNFRETMRTNTTRTLLRALDLALDKLDESTPVVSISEATGRDVTPLSERFGISGGAP